MPSDAPPLVLSLADVERRRDRGELSAWAETAYSELTAKVRDDAFPCTFGTVALRKGDLLLAFVETSETESVRQRVHDCLIEYTDRVRVLDPVAASLLPLAILVTPPEGIATIPEYFTYGWSLLQWLHGRDPRPWPARVPRDPDDPAWSFCFAGVPLFVNFKTPAHHARRSRRMGTAYLLLIQARDGFDVVAGDTPQGRRARDIIRRKLSEYDPIAPYPALGHYGTAANREWKQYFVPDDNEPAAAQCPFHAE
jgi:FPC/CPF motif-containing protein YcgG